MTDAQPTACDLGRAIAAGQQDPVALTEAYLDRIGTQDRNLQIYARATPERARAEAQAARQRARDGVLKGPLDGVPISWKDLFDTAGVATEAGSRMLAGRIPAADARVLENAASTGLICLGKTHLSELAFSGLGVNPQTATSPNAIDPALAPGGSSSGAAVSVARGLAAAGIGSDTGGSVRIPAAWNDLVGFKTSTGSLPMDGTLPLCARFDTIGPLCRSVEDAAALYSAMGALPLTSLDGAEARNLSVLVPENPALAVEDTAPQAAFEDALGRLEAAGMRVTRKRIDALEEAMPLSAILYTPEAYATWGHLIEERGDQMFAPVRERFEAGRGIPATEYIAGWHRLDQVRIAFGAETAAFDAVVLPTSPIMPPPVDKLLSDMDYFVARNLLALRNTRVGNLMNLTGCTLPTGIAHCGIMALCPAGHEARALRVAAAMEKSL